MSHPTRRELIAGAVASLAACNASGDGRAEMSYALRQVIVPWVTTRAGHDAWITLHNPLEVACRVLVQAFDLRGGLVARREVRALQPGQSRRVVVRTLVGPGFEGPIWVGTTPDSGLWHMGLQGVSCHWSGHGYLSSVHALRDFGDPGRAAPWTDLIFANVVRAHRFATRIAIANATGDGISEALTASPELVIYDDEGAELLIKTLPPIPPYGCHVVDLADLDLPIVRASARITEQTAGLVAFAFRVDGDNGGIASADHFTDRHFAVDVT